MVKLLVLGTAHSVADETHRHTHMAVIGEGCGLLIDCGVCPRSRLEALGVGRDGISDVIVTHFHPDHVSGLPLYLMELWLTGRRDALTVHASNPVLDRIEEMLELYEWRVWPGMFPVQFNRIPEREGEIVPVRGDLRVTATPVHHMVPALGLRVDSSSGASLAFSSDTEPSDAFLRLIRGVRLLVHEATGEGVGHCSAGQAGAVASRAGAGRLLLIHYDPTQDRESLLGSAKKEFPGPVELAYDQMVIDLKAKNN